MNSLNQSGEQGSGVLAERSVDGLASEGDTARGLPGSVPSPDLTTPDAVPISPNDQARCACDLAPTLARIEHALKESSYSQKAQEYMSEKLRTLEEAEFERNTLNPILLALISIKDHREDFLRCLHAIRDHLPLWRHDLLNTQFTALEQAVYADIATIENTLSALGVESYCTADNTFDPATQTCVKTLLTAQPEDIGRIHLRLLPGYRRCGRLLRRELVIAYGETVKAARTSTK